MSQDRRAFWFRIASDAYRLPPDASLENLTDELFGYLASPDPELRDEIAVETLTHWIMAGEYSPDTLRQFMRRWMDNLTYRIGETGQPSVLIRSFSALMLSIIAFRDWKTSFLHADEVRYLLDAALRYLADERDVRGYDDKMGWLHAPAHTADLLKFLARNPYTGVEEHKRILTGISTKITAPQNEVYVYSEYQRLGLVVVDVLERNTLDAVTLAAWLEQLASVKWAEPTTPRSLYHGMYQNTKIFLLNFYFLLAHQEPPIPGAHDLQDRVFEALKLFKQ